MHSHSGSGTTLYTPPPIQKCSYTSTALSRIQRFGLSEQGRTLSTRGLFGGSNGNTTPDNCRTCRGKGGIECKGCKGSGRNKKNGNMFERWKCYDCQGFGLVKCPQCGKRGLTPEQRGER